MIDFLVGIDTDILLWMNSFHAPFWDYFMREATDRFIWIAFYVSLIAALWIRFGVKGMIVGVVGACICVLISDQVTASVLRPWVGRLRPSHPENPISDLVHLVNDYRSGRFGFPSSHAANTFGVATMFSLLFRKGRFTIVISCWALLNCYTRVYLGVHYPGDIFVGGIIGILVGLLLYYLIIYISKNWSYFQSLDRPMPSLPFWQKNEFIKFVPCDIPVAVFVLTLLYITLKYLIQL